VDTQPFWRRHEFSLLLAILCVVVSTTILDAQHNYWAKPGVTAEDLIRQWSMLGLFSLGAAVVIIAGGIDLSTGSVIAFGGTICASILLLLAPEAMTGTEPLPVWTEVVAIAGALLVGFLIGSLHAWLITVVQLPPFVATLATLVGLRSLARAICESVTLAVRGGVNTKISIFDASFRYLAKSVWIPAVLLVVLGLALWLMMSRTVLGRHLYALGGNEQAARLSGIPTDRLKWVAYCLSAMLSSLAGVLYICEQSVAEPQTLGRGYELNAIAAAVVGGCSLQGGVGTIPGTLLGALFLRVVIDGVAKTIDSGADVYEGLIVGVVVVFAVTFTGRSAAAGQRRSLFAGGLGLVTLVNLTLIAGVLMALVGVRLLQDHVQMDAAWLAGLTMAAVLALLLIARANWSQNVRRRWGIVWAVVTIVTAIGMDRAYPGVQRQFAISAVQRLGGRVVQNDLGVVIDLSSTAVTDDDLRRLAPKLSQLPPIGELRLSGTKVTDRCVDYIQRLKSLKKIDLTDTPCTPAAATRLQRQLPDAAVQQ
jgi:ribose/xylose/arabinose/galactoside ABC-type transport system permease subunit